MHPSPTHPVGEPLDFDPPDTVAALNRRLNRPLAIGSKTVFGRLVLAPMTCLGHVAMRQVIDRLGGCGLFYSEMCSAGRIPHERPDTSAYFTWRPEEAARLCVQIVGNDPARMAQAARRIEAEGLFGVDINLGCSAKPICRSGWGAALLQEPARAAALVAAVRKAVCCPVTVKFRTGWQDDPDAAVALARRLEDAGADALTFHPRVAPDRRNRPPRWEYIARVKAAVSIPVIGNGNVFCAADCLRMLEQTGCDAVALGRLAIARPWVFAHWVAGRVPHRSDPAAVARQVLQAIGQRFEPARALRRFRRYLPYFAANFRFGHDLLRKAARAQDLDQAATLLDRWLAAGPETNILPNTNFLA